MRRGCTDGTADRGQGTRITIRFGVRGSGFGVRGSGFGVRRSGFCGSGSFSNQHLAISIFESICQIFASLLRCSPMLPARRGDTDGALNAALARLADGAVDRPDTPDLHITAVRQLPAIAAQLVPFPTALDARLTRALAARGVEQLYTHQAQAIDHALAGRNVVVITPTASGKTLCYNGPVLNSILQDSASRALYLFPTKALAQDQLAELQAMCETIDAASGQPIGVYTYDGDTPQDARRTIRSRAHIVLSNPDMVHSGILPHHPRWAKLFENLKFVVIDELHAYRGVFGSHL